MLKLLLRRKKTLGVGTSGQYSWGTLERLGRKITIKSYKKISSLWLILLLVNCRHMVHQNRESLTVPNHYSVSFSKITWVLLEQSVMMHHWTRLQSVLEIFSYRSFVLELKTKLLASYIHCIATHTLTWLHPLIKKKKGILDWIEFIVINEQLDTIHNTGIQGQMSSLPNLTSPHKTVQLSTSPVTGCVVRARGILAAQGMSSNWCLHWAVSLDLGLALGCRPWMVWSGDEDDCSCISSHHQLSGLPRT